MSRARSIRAASAVRVALLLATLWPVALFPAGARAEEPAVLVAHLPSSSIEAASRLAEAVGALVEHLAAQAPGLVDEPEVFRRLKDARSFLATERARIALVLVDASFLLDRPAAIDLVPVERLRIAGRGTYRRLVVVPRGAARTRTLADLRGRSLAVAESAGPSLAEFLKREVFAGEVSPDRWFTELARTADDFAAVASVLYDQTSAALVAEYNPLLESQQGQLRAIYQSPPLSLPVLAYNPARIDDAARARLDRACARLSATSAGRRARELLAIDGFESIGEELAEALLRPPAATPKTLAVALPRVSMPVPEPPAAQDLRWPLSLSLPPETP